MPPKGNKAASSSSLASEITAAEMFAMMKEQMDRIEHAQKDTLSEVKDMKEKYTDLLSKFENHDKDISTIKTTIKALDSTQSSLQEQQERLKRMNNIIVMGVPESSDAVPTLQNLMNIILPGHNLNLNEWRLGKPEEGKVRPCRIQLNCNNDVRRAIANRSFLKDKPEFSSIYVKPDETRAQQMQSKAKREQRIANQPHASQSQPRPKRNADAMDDTPTTTPTASKRPNTGEFNFVYNSQ